MPPAAAVRAAGAAVAQGDLGGADGGEAFEVAAGADPGDAHLGGAFGGRQCAAGLGEGAFDQFGGLDGESR